MFILIVNKTGFKIQNLELNGTTNYNFAIEKDKETGVCKIEWKGYRTGDDGNYSFWYKVKSFSDSTIMYVDSAKCANNIVVNDLSETNVNILTLHIEDVGQSDCDPYNFKIDYKKY